MADIPSFTPASTVHRIGVVEDHEAVVMGLEAMLAPDPSLAVCGSAPTVSELLMQGLELDLAILDLRLADGSSPKTNVEELRTAGLETLIFTGAENPYLVRLAAKAGVLGVVRKSETADVVVAAIVAAVAGQPVVTTEWAAAVDGDPQLAEVDLSPRQRDVLALYASGEKSRPRRSPDRTDHSHRQRLPRPYPCKVRRRRTTSEHQNRSLQTRRRRRVAACT